MGLNPIPIEYETKFDAWVPSQSRHTNSDSDSLSSYFRLYDIFRPLRRDSGPWAQSPQPETILTGQPNTNSWRSTFAPVDTSSL